MSAAAKLKLAHDRLVSLIQAEAKPTGVADVNWPPIINDSDPKKVIPVLTEQIGDIETALKTKLQNIGVGVLVLLPVIGNSSVTPYIVTPTLRFAVCVTDNRQLNKTGKDYLTVIERVLRVVAGQPVFPDSGDEVTIFTVDRTAVEDIGPPPNNKDLASVVSKNININAEIELTP